MILLFLITAALFILGLGILVGSWLRSMEQEADYHEALDSLRRIRGV